MCIRDRPDLYLQMIQLGMAGERGQINLSYVFGLLYGCFLWLFRGENSRKCRKSALRNRWLTHCLHCFLSQIYDLVCQKHVVLSFCCQLFDAFILSFLSVAYKKAVQAMCCLLYTSISAIVWFPTSGAYAFCFQSFVSFFVVHIIVWVKLALFVRTNLFTSYNFSFSFKRSGIGMQ